MYLFLDTEFTDFKDCDLISIGIVSEDGQHEFYVEITDYTEGWASPFVREVVVPMLDHNKHGKPFAAASVALNEWLEALPSKEILVIIDYGMDHYLFSELVNDSPVRHSKKTSVRMIDPAFRHVLHERGYHSVAQQTAAWGVIVEQTERYFRLYDERQHHALVDAKANRHGWVEGLKIAASV
jgi:hypothetical protein